MFTKIVLICSVLIALSLPAIAQDAEIVFSRSPKAAEGATDFKSGEYIYAHIKFNKPISEVLTVESSYISFTSELYAGSRMLGEEFSAGHDPDKIRSAKETIYVIPIVSDPAFDLFNFGSKKFAFEMPKGLGKLNEGTHEIQLKVKSYAYKDGGDYLAMGKFNLSVESGAQVWYQKNEQAARDAQLRKGSSANILSASTTGSSVMTLVNNCKRSVWLRFALGSDKKEHRLGPGQTMRYNTDYGYLEEWNFGTKKWTTVKTMFSPDSSGKANICAK